MNLVLSGIIAALTIVIGALVLYLRTFTSAYASKKGENLATHEDIQKLVDQVKAVTKTQEEIKAQISDDLWTRQRRWELKKEVAFELLKELGNLQWRLPVMAGWTHQRNITNDTTQQQKIAKEIETLISLVDTSVNTLGGMMTVALVTNEKGVIDALGNAHTALIEFARGAMRGDFDEKSLVQHTNKSFAAIHNVAAAIRIELQMDRQLLKE